MVAPSVSPSFAMNGRLHRWKQHEASAYAFFPVIDQKAPMPRQKRIAVRETQWTAPSISPYVATSLRKLPIPEIVTSMKSPG